MNETKTKWDIRKVKRLKRKQLMQYNLVMLILFILSVYFVKIGGSMATFFSIGIPLLWIITAYTIYALITGKIIGTKTSKRVQTFNLEYWGKRRWKRKRVIGAIVISVLSILCTVIVATVNFNSEASEIHNVFPIVGAWLGFNIGETFKIKKL